MRRPMVDTLTWMTQSREASFVLALGARKLAVHVRVLVRVLVLVLAAFEVRKLAAAQTHDVLAWRMLAALAHVLA